VKTPYRKFGPKLKRLLVTSYYLVLETFLKLESPATGLRGVCHAICSLPLRVSFAGFFYNKKDFKVR
jgi:hypothetical protein